jgi:predicted Zn finger-like uncharacterized protein
VIVTCPSCDSKYRVRDEAVPPEGAELQCPTCSAVFVAQRPKVDADAVAGALEKMTRAREAAELRVLELEKELAAAKAGADELMRRGGSKEVELARALDDAARADARAQAAEQSVRRLTEEVSRSRVVAGDQAELLSVKQQLFDAQKRQRGLQAELEVANALVASLQTDVTVLRSNNSVAAQSDAAKKIAALQAELETLRAQADMVEVPSSQTQSMIAAIGPMLWGLDQSVAYLEHFAGNEPTLAGHVKQLRLLQKLLQKLAESP